MGKLGWKKYDTKIPSKAEFVENMPREHNDEIIQVTIRPELSK